MRPIVARRAPLGFNWSEGEGSAAVLRFDETLPAETPLRIDLGLAGVALVVAPWNYPMMMAIWKLAPAICAATGSRCDPIV